MTSLFRSAQVALTAAALAVCGGQPPAQQGAATAPTAPACSPQAFASLQARFDDFGGLKRYAEENATLPPPGRPNRRVVFFGDSLTDAWGRLADTGSFFPGKPYLNRGISGQTTPQLLLRFEQDVVALHPAAVVILGGTNDIAGNTGPSTPRAIENNFAAMVQLGKASGIKVILASITPADHYNWKPGVQPASEIRDLNTWIRQYCASGACMYLDYYAAMSDSEGRMRPGYSKDGVHPTAKGYAVMAPLAEAAIAQALGN